MRSFGHDVTVSPKGVTNGDVLALAISDKRVLVTHDTDFAKKLLPAGHPGIVVVRIPSRHFELFKVSFTRLMSAKSAQDHFVGMLIFLWEDKFEESPFSFS